jgi:Flp pilus assembly protein TadD
MMKLAPLLCVVAFLSGGCAGISIQPDDPAAEAQARVLDEMVEARQDRQDARAESPQAEPGPDMASLIQEGDVQRRGGEVAQALWSYLKAHDLDRSDPEPLLRIASIHIHGDPERAAAIFRKLDREHPDSATAKTGLGLVYVAQGDEAAAETALREALQREPDFPAAHNALGLVLDRQGNPSEGRPHFVRASELQPRSYVPLNNLGVSFLKTQENERAVAVLQRASLVEHRDPAVFNNLGVGLARLGRFEQALAAFRRAGPEHAAWNNLGTVRLERGELDAAILAYEQALLAAPIDDRLEILRNLEFATRKRTEESDAAPAAPAP